MADKELLLGDEAVAQAALDAGISGAYSYPGTPSTEIMEHIINSDLAAKRDVHRNWSSNEKTALETALGVSYCNRRALVSMKHVGLNVAADPFVNSAITGVRGGLVLAVADDPSMHSSQNEQDTRFYGRFAGVPVLEPTDQQSAYEMTREAFEISERFELPVIVRLVTRLAHSRADVELGPKNDENSFSPETEHNRYTLIPLNARNNYRELVDKEARIKSAAEKSQANQEFPGQSDDRALVASGVAFNYLKEYARENEFPHPVLRITQYPLPKRKLSDFVNRFEEVLVFEDGQPFIEEFLVDAFGAKKVQGRLDGTLPRTGELTPDNVGTALGVEASEPKQNTADEDLPARPPRLCPGCPHADTFEFLKEVLESSEQARAFSDIGCYTLGFLPPYEAIHTCVDMGASVTMAKGAADAGLHPSMAVIGDSTFTHSGMTGLLDAVHESTPITVLILDNSTTAMTGGQDSLAEGRLEDICLGMGVEKQHLHTLKPIPPEKEENLEVLENEVEYEGVSVLVVRRACVQI